MERCAQCGGETATAFRYCPWCSTPQRRKLVEFFRGVDDDSKRALRVSRYLPEQRVRFSVWDETGRVRAAVSLDEDEAARLGAFVTPPAPSRWPRVLDDLRALVGRDRTDVTSRRETNVSERLGSSPRGGREAAGGSSRDRNPR